MTEKPPILTDGELAALTPDERAFFMDAWLAIPPERENEVRVLAMLSRGIIKHDLGGFHTEVKGVYELQDRADENARDLIDAAKEMRAATVALTANVATATNQIAKFHIEFTAFAQSSTHDRFDLRQRSRLHRRWLWGLTVAVVALAIEALWRWWPVLSVLLLSFVALLWRW
jgi:hypothetical protein